MSFQVAQAGHQGNTTRGIAIVELASVLPFLLLFLMGVIEISVLIHDKAIITNASREGARFGITAFGAPHSDDAIQAKVHAYVQNRLISFSASPTALTTVTRGGSVAGSPLRVKVDYPYQFLVFPNLHNSFASSLTLSAETTMRLE